MIPLNGLEILLQIISLPDQVIEKRLVMKLVRKCLVVKAHLEGQMKTHVYMWFALANKVFLGGTAEMSMARS